MVPVLIASSESFREAMDPLLARFPNVEFRFSSDAELAESLTSDVVVLAGDGLPQVGSFDSLRWVHVFSAGYNHLLGKPLPNPEVMVTNSSGGFTDGIAEFVLMRMLMFARRAEALYEAQKRHEWPRRRLSGATTLRGKRLVIIGSGSIGKEVARLGEAFGMSVRLCGRQDGPRLPEFVADARYIVVAASLTASSRGIVSRALMAAMKARPYIVNVSRGALIETGALIDAIREGTVAGAALDVFDQEPLPPESPLYSTPGISISPHLAGVFDEVKDNLAELYARNLECFLEGRPLPNRIWLDAPTNQQTSPVPGTPPASGPFGNHPTSAR